jgi:hypothetical protein
MAPEGSLPHSEITKQLQSDRKVATAELKRGGRLGLGRWRRRALGLLVFWVRAPGGVAAAL